VLYLPQNAFKAEHPTEDPIEQDGMEDEEPTTSRAREEELDPETFDDTDFYQQLLKEFLDSSGTSSECPAVSGSPRFLPSSSERKCHLMRCMQTFMG
jgi:hypothetical protein